MTQPDHLTDEQIAHYHARTLAPAQLLAVDDHLAHCEECRDLLYHAADAGSQIRALQADLAVRSPARQFPFWLAAAAAVLLAAGFFLSQRKPVEVARTTAPTEAPLTAEQAALLNAHKLERAPILARLTAQRGVLLGLEPQPKGFAVTQPVGTAVVTDRPTFQWTGDSGKCVVAVFDEGFNKVLESPAITGNEWQPEKALARDRIYYWQVSTTISGKPVHAPTPPAPEARFQVASQTTADSIESARRDHPNDHTLLAALYARAGALLDMNKELDLLAAQDPATAAALRQSLK
jgi:hypothetical protein